MKTNLEKWDYYLGELNKRADEFMDTIMKKEDVPLLFYIPSFKGDITECTVLKRYYSFKLYFYGEKPTNKDVQKAKEVYESNFIFDKKDAYLEYTYNWGETGKAKTSIHLHDIMNNVGAFADKKLAQEMATKLKTEFDAKHEFQLKHKKDASYNYSQNGYKFLGWQNGWKHVYFDEDGNVTTGDESKGEKPKRSFGYLEADYPEYGKCIREKHQRIDVSHNNRGSEHTVSCPLCMIYWKYDSSD